jgi:Rrf2 family protein
MAANARFTVAVHILTLLADEKDRPLTSDYIAGSVNTNPVVIRRVLALLGKAGLVSATEGAGGGSTLARPAARITLADVRRAVKEGGLFTCTRSNPNPMCPVGCRLQSVLKEYMQQFEKTLEKQMNAIAIADVLKGVRSPVRQ